MASQWERFAVVIPAGQKLHTVAAKSGMVARWENNTTVVDFEGGIYGQSNIVTYADRVAVAAGRAAENYPTVARRHVEPADVVVVGSFDPLYGRILVESGMGGALADWLDVSVEDLNPQLETTDPASVDVRMFAAWPAHHRALHRQALAVLPASVRARLGAAGLL